MGVERALYAMDEWVVASNTIEDARHIDIRRDIRRRISPRHSLQSRPDNPDEESQLLRNRSKERSPVR